MARPKKKGVDYFPHDCVAGKTIFILEQKFGNDGYAFWFKLLEFLGTKDGHFLDCANIPDMEFLQAKTHLAREKMYEIFDLLAGLEAIDVELWGKRVVWSQRFVDGISDVYTNRRMKTPEKPSFYIVSTQQNPAQLNNEAQSTSESTQSKVKERKEEESKVNTTVGGGDPPAPEKKRRSGIVKSKKNPEAEPYWGELVKTYFSFCYEKFNEKPSFDGSAPSDMHRIIETLRQRAAEKNIEWTAETAILRWRGFLGTAHEDDWLSKNWLLSNLNRQKDKIFLNLVNAKNGTHQQQFGNGQPKLGTSAARINTAKNW